MKLYTSYETSLRLKEAGAPQDSGKYEPATWWVDHHIGGGPEIQDSQDAAEVDARAFRADEIVAELGVCLSAIYQSVTGYFDVHYELLGLDLEPVFTGSIERDTLVEALAATWIAVLEKE